MVRFCFFVFLKLLLLVVLSFAKWLHDICQLRQGKNCLKGFPKHTVSVNWIACYCQGLAFVFLSFVFLFNIFNFVFLFGLYFYSSV